MRVAWMKRTSANACHSFQIPEASAELAAQPSLGVGVRFELVESEQRSSDDRRRRRRSYDDGRRGLAEAGGDRSEQVAVNVLQNAAAEQDLHGLVGEVKPCHCN